MIKELLKSVREYKKPSLLSPLFVSMEVVFECIIPLIMASLIDHMNGASMRPIITDGLLLLLLSMASLFCGQMAARQAAKGATGLAKNLRQDIYFKVQDFSFADVDKFSTSSLVTRMTTDVTNIMNAYQMLIRGAVRTPLMILFSVIMGFSINARMALIFLAILPVLGISIFGIARLVFPIFRRIFKRYDAMNNSVQENISGIRVVKSFVREAYEIGRFQETSENVRQDFTAVEKILAFNMPIMMACIYATMLFISFFGAKIIVSTKGSALTTGELSSLISYGIQILAAMMMLSFVFVMIMMAEEPLKRVTEVLTHNSTLTSPKGGITEVKDGHIVFRNVSFSYAKYSKKPALSEINLDIPAGSTLGILGSTGSAKTTLIQLIPRLYDVTAGKVLVGGVDVRSYDLVSLRDAVAVVLQKNVLFSGTIKENLRWGKKDATEEDMRRVCRLACAEEFICELPKGYDTYIERGGTNVSGGQKQRLCIARALLKSPKILILDDSTSAVDTRTDALIRRALSSELPEMTKIIIAQRVSSVQEADNIIVMDGGKIAEAGSHEALMALGGIYKETYESQVKGKEA